MKLIYTGDFERLKEFGFEYNEVDCDEFTYKYYAYKPRYAIEVIQIDITSRIIYLCDNDKNEGLIKIYDLIQAGLVKKENRI